MHGVHKMQEAFRKGTAIIKSPQNNACCSVSYAFGRKAFLSDTRSTKARKDERRDSRSGGGPGVLVASSRAECQARVRLLPSKFRVQ